VGDAMGVPYQFRHTDETATVTWGAIGTHGVPPGIHWGLNAIPQEWLAGMRGREIAQPIVDRLIMKGRRFPWSRELCAHPPRLPGSGN